jgi:hypothetical protein
MNKLFCDAGVRTMTLCGDDPKPVLEGLMSS